MVNILISNSSNAFFQLKSVDEKSIKTSKDFFSRLQDQGKSEIEKNKRLMKQNRKNTKKFKK